MSRTWEFLRTQVIPVVGLVGIALAVFGAILGWQQAQDAKAEAILAQRIAGTSATAAREAARAAQNGEIAASSARDAAQIGEAAASSARDAALSGETAASRARDAARSDETAASSAKDAASAALIAAEESRIAAEESRKVARMVATLLTGGRFDRPSYLPAPLLSNLADLVVCDGDDCRVPRGTIAIAKDAETAAVEATTLLTSLPRAPGGELQIAPR